MAHPAHLLNPNWQLFWLSRAGTDAYLHLNRLRNVQEPLP